VHSSGEDRNTITSVPVQTSFNSDSGIILESGASQSGHAVTWLAVHRHQICVHNYFITCFDEHRESNCLVIRCTMQEHGRFTIVGFLLRADQELTSSNVDPMRVNCSVDRLIKVQEVKSSVDRERLEQRCFCDIKANVSTGWDFNFVTFYW